MNTNGTSPGEEYVDTLEENMAQPIEAKPYGCPLVGLIEMCSVLAHIEIHEREIDTQLAEADETS